MYYIFRVYVVSEFTGREVYYHSYSSKAYALKVCDKKGFRRFVIKKVNLCLENPYADQIWRYERGEEI